MHSMRDLIEMLYHKPRAEFDGEALGEFSDDEDSLEGYDGKFFSPIHKDIVETKSKKNESQSEGSDKVEENLTKKQKQSRKELNKKNLIKIKQENKESVYEDMFQIYEAGIINALPEELHKNEERIMEDVEEVDHHLINNTKKYNKIRQKLKNKYKALYKDIVKDIKGNKYKEIAEMVYSIFVTHNTKVKNVKLDQYDEHIEYIVNSKIDTIYLDKFGNPLDNDELLKFKSLKTLDREGSQNSNDGIQIYKEILNTKTGLIVQIPFHNGWPKDVLEWKKLKSINIEEFIDLIHKKVKYEKEKIDNREKIVMERSSLAEEMQSRYIKEMEEKQKAQQPPVIEWDFKFQTKNEESCDDQLESSPVTLEEEQHHKQLLSEKVDRLKPMPSNVAETSFSNFIPAIPAWIQLGIDIAEQSNRQQHADTLSDVSAIDGNSESESQIEDNIEELDLPLAPLGLPPLPTKDPSDETEKYEKKLEPSHELYNATKIKMKTDELQIFSSLLNESVNVSDIKNNSECRDGLTNSLANDQLLSELKSYNDNKSAQKKFKALKKKKNKLKTTIEQLMLRKHDLSVEKQKNETKMKSLNETSKNLSELTNKMEKVNSRKTTLEERERVWDGEFQEYLNKKTKYKKEKNELKLKFNFLFYKSETDHVDIINEQDNIKKLEN